MSLFVVDRRLCAAALLAVLPAWAVGCETFYFSARDYANEIPLKQPAREFVSLMTAARNGNGQAQRSLAVSYETGYLVAPCSRKAAYWYERAAASGDVVAREWQARNKRFSTLLAGPECSADACLDSDAPENRTAILYASTHRGEHYFAPITINGQTVEGLIDTGASDVAMSIESARLFGIDFAEGKRGLSATAAGNITTTRVVVPQVEVAGVKLRNVRVTVGITGAPLIGMSFLSRVDLLMGTGVLVMKKRQ